MDDLLAEAQESFEIAADFDRVWATWGETPEDLAELAVAQRTFGAGARFVGED